MITAMQQNKRQIERVSGSRNERAKDDARGQELLLRMFARMYARFHVWYLFACALETQVKWILMRVYLYVYIIYSSAELPIFGQVEL